MSRETSILAKRVRRQQVSLTKYISADKTQERAKMKQEIEKLDQEQAGLVVNISDSEQQLTAVQAEIKEL